MQNNDRIEDSSFLSKITDATTAASYIRNGMNIGFGGFAACGHPKAVPQALAKRVEEGEELSIKLISSGNIGSDIEDLLSESNIISRRTPLQIGSPKAAKKINQGTIDYVELSLSKLPKMMKSGVLGEIDVAIIEVLKIKENGRLVLTSGIGLTPAMIELAKEIIVEINTSQPEILEYINDIYITEEEVGKSPIPLYSVNQHIGTREVVINPEKIKYIVFSDIPDEEIGFNSSDKISEAISNNLLNFLEYYQQKIRSKILPPIQTGVGNVANNIAKSFERSNFRDISFYCGVLQEGNIEMLDKGIAIAASGSAVNITSKVREIFENNPEMIKKNLVLRNMEITNCAEMVDRMQLIAINALVELDIYGNANLSHLMGSKVVNGIGGAGEFTQNSSLSIMAFSSSTKNGDISTIVPKVSHQDISVHNIDVVITEKGVADLRGKTPVERARLIINNCANELYASELLNYLNKSLKEGGHIPQLLDECFSWHKRLKETKSMLNQE